MGKVGPCARAWAAARCCCWQADCHRWSCGGASTPAGTAGSATTPEKEKYFSFNVCTSRKNELYFRPVGFFFYSLAKYFMQYVTFEEKVLFYLLMKYKIILLNNNFRFCLEFNQSVSFQQFVPINNALMNYSIRSKK